MKRYCPRCKKRSMKPSGMIRQGLKKKICKRKKSTTYRRGDLNRLIDSIFHPLYRKNELFRILDGLVHGVVEKDPVTSGKKLLQYNFPDLIKIFSKRKRGH